MAMLPGGISQLDLDKLWSYVKDCLQASSKQGDKKNIDSEMQDSSNVGNDSKW